MEERSVYGGGDVDTLIDLQQHRIEFTVAIPFDQRNLTFYVLALRNGDLAQENEGATHAYFDQVAGGIWLYDQWKVIYQDGFENQPSFPDVPATVPTVKVENFQEGFWYKENEEALVDISSDYALEGSTVQFVTRASNNCIA